VSGRVIVVASVNVDLVVIVDRLPAPGETVTGAQFTRHHGGKGGNQAVAAARLGAPTAFVGAIGGDAFGREARAALEAEGIDLRGLVELPDEATGVALIQVDATGENTIAVAGGANATLSPDHVQSAMDRLAPRPGDVILVGHEIQTSTTEAALRLARAAGATTILNPAPARGLSRAVVALADVTTPNRIELTELVGVDQPEAGPAARDLLGDPSDRAILVSLGAEGALLVQARETTPLPAPTGLTVVDAVGAGDTLNGALAAGLAAGLSLADAARRAVVAASLAVTRAGAREGMPTSAELEAAVRAR
jgi:ribokinase